MTDFNVRFEKAKEMLRLWDILQNIPAEDEEKKEERVQYKNKFIALLSDPLQVNVELLLTDTAKREDIFKLVSAMYGSDAVSFAFKAIEREHWR